MPREDGAERDSPTLRAGAARIGSGDDDTGDMVGEGDSLLRNTPLLYSTALSINRGGRRGYNTSP